MNRWDHYFMMMAHQSSQMSKDPSTKVGAIIVRPDRTIAATGWNGLPRGVIDHPARYADRDLKLKLVVHAEINAILAAHEPLAGYTIYLWPFMPCSNCAGALIQSGIKRVVSFENDNPRWADAFALTHLMFDEAGVQLDLLPAEESALRVVA